MLSVHVRARGCDGRVGEIGRVGVNLNYRQLEALVSVAERANISHAAVALSMSQPALSRLISKIETDLGTELFERDGRGVTPTEAGTRVLAHAEDVLRRLDDMEDEIRSLDGHLRGKVCVAMPDVVGHTMFLPLIDRFAEEHPHVELRVMGAHPNNVPLALSAGDGDVGVISSAHKQSGIHQRRFALEHLHLVGPKGSPARSEIPVAEIGDLPLALPGIQPGLRQLIDRAFAMKGVKPNVVMELDSQEALVELIRFGRVHSIMSFAGVMRHVGRGDLVATRIVDPTIDRELSTALPEGRPATRLMRAVESEIRALAAGLSDAARWELVLD